MNDIDAAEKGEQRIRSSFDLKVANEKSEDQRNLISIERDRACEAFQRDQAASNPLVGLYYTIQHHRLLLGILMRMDPNCVKSTKDNTATLIGFCETCKPFGVAEAYKVQLTVAEEQAAAGSYSLTPCRLNAHYSALERAIHQMAASPAESSKDQKPSVPNKNKTELFRSGDKSKGTWIQHPLSRVCIAKSTGIEKRSIVAVFGNTGLIQETPAKWSVCLDGINKTHAAALAKASADARLRKK